MQLMNMFIHIKQHKKKSKNGNIRHTLAYIPTKSTAKRCSISTVLNILSLV